MTYALAHFAVWPDSATEGRGEGIVFDVAAIVDLILNYLFIPLAHVK